jgi:hypothetical protein
MKYSLSIFCFLIAFGSFSQRFSSEMFHKGFLVTTENDTIQGDLKYDLETNILLVIKAGKTQSYSSHKVYYFEIYDVILKNYRQFYSIPFKVSYDYKIPIFFELVYEGKLSLLQREAIVVQTTNNNSAYWGGGSIQQTVIIYTYYFLDNQGKITYFSGKKKDLLIIMQKKQSDVKKFIKDNRLDAGDTRDLIRITAFFNSI